MYANERAVFTCVVIVWLIDLMHVYVVILLYVCGVCDGIFLWCVALDLCMYDVMVYIYLYKYDKIC